MRIHKPLKPPTYSCDCPRKRRRVPKRAAGGRAAAASPWGRGWAGLKNFLHFLSPRCVSGRSLSYPCAIVPVIELVFCSVAGPEGAMDLEAMAAIPVAALGAMIGPRHAGIVADQAELMAMIGSFDAREGWRADGAVSMATWLVAALKVTYATASGWVALAGALPGLPKLAASLGDGEVCLESAAAAAQLATLGSGRGVTDEGVTTEAKALPADLLNKAVRRQEQAAAQAAPQSAAARPRAALRWWHSEDGWWQFRGWLPPEAGEALARAIDRAEDDGPDPATGEYDPGVRGGARRGRRAGHRAGHRGARLRGGGARRGGAPAGVRRPHRSSARPPLGGGGDRAGQPPGARPPAALPEGPRRLLPVPRLWAHPAPARPPHPALGQRRGDRAEKPAPAVPSPPRPGARGGLVADRQPRARAGGGGHPELSPARRHRVPAHGGPAAPRHRRDGPDDLPAHPP